MNPRRYRHAIRERLATCEGLERRQLLSGSAVIDSFGAGLDQVDRLSVVATEPSAGAVLTEAPTTLAVRFSRPVDPFSLFIGDVRLYRVGGDGTLVPVFDEQSAPWPEVDPNDPSRVLAMIGPDMGLEAGEYRIALAGWSMLAMELDPSGFALTPEGDLILGDFSIGVSRPSLAEPIDLGRLGPEQVTVRGTLDLSDPAVAVALYRITLGPRHPLWRLGLEVSAQRDGSPLDTTLSLFDAQGRPIAVAQDGRSDFPADPYLFAGLRPGTYLIGISGPNDLPGQSGGYDAGLREPGAHTGAGGAGGEFTLNLVADPAGARASVVGFRLNQADSADPAPTGFDLQFSGPLVLGRPGAPIHEEAQHWLELVDQNGRSWPIHVVGTDEREAAIRVIFGMKLPAGLYEVRLPAVDRRLTDLIGRAPFTPGLPAGTLATFVVTDEAGRGPVSRAPDDLGILYPDSLPNGMQIIRSLPAGGRASFRLVVLRDTFVRSSLAYAEAELAALELVDLATGASRSFDPGPSMAGPNALVTVKAGTYLLRLTAGANPVHFDLKLAIDGFSNESLLQNGLGQGPALSMRLVAPAGSSLIPPDSPVGAIGAIAPGGPSLYPTPLIPGDNGAAPPEPPGAGAAPGADFTVTGGLVLSLEGGLVGQPSPSSAHVTPVGPGSTAALALAGNGASAVILAGLGLGQGGFEPAPGMSTTLVEPSDGALVDTEMETEESDPPPRLPVPARAGPDLDNATLADLATWIESFLSDGIGPQVPSLEDPALALSSVEGQSEAEAITTTALAANGGESETPLQEASAAHAPLGLGLLAIVVIQFREKIAGWCHRLRPWQRQRTSAAPDRATPRRPFHLAGSRDRSRIR